MEFAGVGPEWPLARVEYLADLAEHPVEPGERTGRADDRLVAQDRAGDEIAGPGEGERQRAGDPVHRPGEGLDVVVVRGPVGMEDQDAVHDRGPGEGARVGD